MEWLTLVSPGGSFFLFASAPWGITDMLDVKQSQTERLLLLPLLCHLGHEPWRQRNWSSWLTNLGKQTPNCQWFGWDT
jgi:hypothetical protein